MEMITQLKALELLTNLIRGDTDKINSFNYTPQKFKQLPMNSKEQALPRSTPEEQGISSKYISNFYKAVSNEKSINAHSIMILKNGNVIASGSFAPFNEKYLHITHSLCKSITSLAVGIAIDEGLISLDDKISDIFKGYPPNLLSPIRIKAITIRHLLTMSSGIKFNEMGAVIENDWVRSFLTSSVTFEPGSKFAYNSMNTYMLSAIIKQKSSEGLLEYLQKRVFDFMGISGLFWEVCPKGIEKGGWGLNIYIEDMAKIGQLFLQEGEWNGKQLVSKEWILAATSNQISTDEELSNYGYGYQVWMCKYPGVYQFNGMLNQSVIVIPDKNMVIAATCGSEYLVPVGKYSDLVEQYFMKPDNDIIIDESKNEPNLEKQNEYTNILDKKSNDRGFDNEPDSSNLNEHYKNYKALSYNSSEYNELQRVLLTLKFDTPYHELASFPYKNGWDNLYKNNSNKGNHIKNSKKIYIKKKYTRIPSDNMTYYLPLTIRLESFLSTKKCYEIESSIASVLPLFIQCIHVNYTKGISHISFEINNHLLTIKIDEGEDINIIQFSLKSMETIYSDINMNGETYTVATIPTITTDEDEHIVLKLKICFVETSNTRTIKFFFLDENNIKIEFDELPKLQYLLDGVANLISSDSKTDGINPINAISDSDFARYRINQVMTPTVTGKLIE